MKFQKTAILILLFLTMFCAGAIAQNSASSSPANSSPTVSKEQAVARLISEVKAARTLINAQTEQIAVLESQIKTETENSQSFEKSYQAAKSEISALHASNDALEKAVALHTQTIALLQTDLIKERQSKKKWRKRTFQAAGTLAVIVLTGIL